MSSHGTRNWVDIANAARCVGGLIDFWLSVNERLRPAAPGPEGSDQP